MLDFDFEFVENDNEHMGSTLDDIIRGVKGWGVHFSSGMRKPMANWVDPASIPKLFPNAHPGYQILHQTWPDEARSMPLGLIPSRRLERWLEWYWLRVFQRWENESTKTSPQGGAGKCMTQNMDGTRQEKSKSSNY